MDNLCTSIVKPDKDDLISVQLYGPIFQITTKENMKHKYVFIHSRNDLFLNLGFEYCLFHRLSWKSGMKNKMVVHLKIKSSKCQ